MPDPKSGALPLGDAPFERTNDRVLLKTARDSYRSSLDPVQDDRSAKMTGSVYDAADRACCSGIPERVFEVHLSDFFKGLALDRLLLLLGARSRVLFDLCRFLLGRR